MGDFIVEPGCCASIIGPMYAGKTTALINIIRDCKRKGQVVLACKPKKDNRYGVDTNLHSHDGDMEECLLIEKTSDILILNNELYNKSNIVIIEEAHFFDPSIVTDVEKMLDDGKYVVISGLSGNYQRRAIGSIPDLLALSHTIKQICAKCELCSSFTVAPFTAKISGDHCREIEIGGKTTYIPVCGKHYVKFDS